MSYINEKFLPYAFCPGCGHSAVVDNLNKAFEKLGIEKNKLVMVTDIGCCGVIDKYFLCNGVHTLHGRSFAVASGIKLADPTLKVVVLVGDGGCGIGLNHLINLARRNIGVTVIVCNNFNFGMTGGQHSVTTPRGMFTTTTKYGNLESHLDLCEIVSSAGGNFFARTNQFETNIDEVFFEALNTDGFSMVEVWEFCTAYFIPSNKLNRRQFLELSKNLNMPFGVLKKRDINLFSGKCPGVSVPEPDSIEIKYRSGLKKRCGIYVAGGAGQRVRFASSLFAKSAISCGLWATQKDDFPITVMTGYSISEILLDTNEIFYTGIDKPDFLIALHKDGVRFAREKILKMDKSGVILKDKDVDIPQTEAQIVEDSFKKRVEFDKNVITLYAIAFLLKRFNLFPLAALEESVLKIRDKKVRENNLRALKIL